MNSIWRQATSNPLKVTNKTVSCQIYLECIHRFLLLKIVCVFTQIGKQYATNSKGHTNFDLCMMEQQIKI